MPSTGAMRMRRCTSSRAGLEDEVARLREPAADDDALRVEHEHDVRDRDAEPAPRVGERRERDGVARARRLDDRLARSRGRPPRATQCAATYASTQPGLPQPQTGASGEPSTVVCPSSPAQP